MCWHGLNGAKSTVERHSDSCEGKERREEFSWAKSNIKQMLNRQPLLLGPKCSGKKPPPRTATSSPSEESTSGMHSAHKVSAEWDSADKIIPLFYLSEGSQVWIWRAIFQDFPPCKFKSKWLYAGASLTPPSCQGWFKISEREVSRAGFLNRLFSLHCSMAQCSELSRSLNFQHWYIPCVLCSWWASIWCWGWSNGPHGGGVWGAINSLLVLWWHRDCVWLEERKIRRKWAGGDIGDLFARI